LKHAETAMKFIITIIIIYWLTNKQCNANKF